MIKWLEQRINRVSEIERYSKPESLKSNFYKLDANENVVLDPKFLNRLLSKKIEKIDLRKYPLELYDELYENLSSYLGLSHKHLVLGNGSDQVIDLLLSVIGSGKRVTLFTPTFTYFISRCQLHDIQVSRIPLCPNNNRIMMGPFIKSATKSELVYLCSPNNPTGNQIERSIIREILQLKNVFVILDEAYVEFAEYSMTEFIEDHANLAILRTFSKAFGIAGCRLGYLVTNKRLAHFIRNSIQSPYPINSLSLVVAISLLSNLGTIQKSVKLIKTERQRLFENISKIDLLRTYQSDSNFLFIKIRKRYAQTVDALQRHGISVKELGNLPGYGRCLRITVGTPQMNDITLKALKSI